VSDPLPLDLPKPLRPEPCWYCGTTTGAFENEHQRPVSRGGRYGDNLVRACAACNHLKGKLTLEEFRTALERRLGVSPVVFAGEAEPGHPATPIDSVRSLAGTPDVVKLDPLVGERLDRALTWLARRGRGATRKDAVSAAVSAFLDDLAAAELDGDDFPEDAVLPFEGFGPEPIFRQGEASQTPRSVWDREVTKVDSVVLGQARRTVAFLKSVGKQTNLVDYVTGAVAAWNEAARTKYPQLSMPDSAESDEGTQRQNAAG
jgi:HNH endonuclease